MWLSPALHLASPTSAVLIIFFFFSNMLPLISIMTQIHPPSPTHPHTHTHPTCFPSLAIAQYPTALELWFLCRYGAKHTACVYGDVLRGWHKARALMLYWLFIHCFLISPPRPTLRLFPYRHLLYWNAGTYFFLNIYIYFPLQQYRSELERMNCPFSGTGGRVGGGMKENYCIYLEALYRYRDTAILLLCECELCTIKVYYIRCILFLSPSPPPPPPLSLTHTSRKKSGSSAVSIW